MRNKVKLKRRYVKRVYNYLMRKNVLLWAWEVWRKADKFFGEEVKT